MMRLACLWLCLGLHFSEVFCSQSRFGVLVVTDNDFRQEFCIKFYPELYNLTTNADGAESFKLNDVDDLSQVETCDENDPKLENVRGKVGFVSAKNTTGNCSIAERAILLEAHGSTGLLSDLSVSSNFNATQTGRTSNFVATLYHDSAPMKLSALRKERSDAVFIIFAPNDPEGGFDGSILLIFAMAVFTVGLGSFWSGYTKHHLRERKLNQLALPSHGQVRSSSSNSTNGEVLESPKSPDNQQQQRGGDVSVKITPLWVLTFVCCMCLMLVMLYFFFSALVYIIIAMFVLASIIAIYACFEPLVMWTYEAFPNCPTVQFPKCHLYLCIVHVELRQLLLMAFAVTVALIWVVFRNEYWAWVLQDILGILFSINVLRVLRLPSFMICTILLGILFFYDIFFVFITPLITSDGKSVMVEVATGGSSGEQLPMVLKVPHFGHDPFSSCWTAYSMLGFGDILVPGLLVSYCLSFDLLKKTPFHIYWTTAMFCYCGGLLICFGALFLMNYAQPALLYIVPCTLIPVAIIACIRGEFKEIWDGDKLPVEIVDNNLSRGGDNADVPNSKDEEDRVPNQEELAKTPKGNSPAIEEEEEEEKERQSKRKIKKEDSQNLLN